ncbi:AN1-type zinc finger domain-containing protein [Phanerochaete sordida]|uniref:AN1-type zinc finger domain-containing protein n=1 Tax=Phanerochaete sordida TaxID=48140 RepID=A0A9P3GNX0_9APHY|nr:AN1-type zinc finger domain-containing protein [Phanerochaete sordida]
MASSSTPAPERDAHLLAVGQQCSAELCHLVDFLPFKCQHCAQPFCADHFLPAQHKCAEYGESKHNRVAPSCPLCNTPVAIPPGQDPNVRMERHINTECSVMTGRTAKSKTPHCARAKCGKVLFQPIKCDSCKQQFCPQHRFPKDHDCSSVSTAATPKPQASAAARGNAALSAIKRATAQSNPAPSRTPALAPAPLKPAATSSAPSSASRPKPFSKTDRAPAAPTLPQPTPHPPTNGATTTHDHPHDPPQTCVPKSIINPRAFTPPPLFARA